jgi:uncharacterized membrane protein (GlpM family)
MSYDNLSSVSQNVLEFDQQLTGEERRIPFIFDDFHFCRSRVIGLDMTENGIFTLCRMITWVVFLRMFWNLISSLPVKRGGSLSFLTIFTFVVPELLDLIWRENRIFTLCRIIIWVVFLRMFWNFISRLSVKRGGFLSFLVGTISNVLVMEIGWTDVESGGYILVSCAHSNTSFCSDSIKDYIVLYNCNRFDKRLHCIV